jgi:hypothetical protein
LKTNTKIKNNTIMSKHKQIMEMIESSITAKDARDILNMYYSLGSISSEQLEKYKKIVKKQFETI